MQESEDGSRLSIFFMLPDKMMIETVLMRQSYGLSVCVTTQVDVIWMYVLCLWYSKKSVTH